MRALTLLAFTLAGCGGSSTPSTVPTPEPPAEVIDVAEVAPVGPGFGFSSTIHRTKSGYAYQLYGQDQGWDPVSVDGTVDLAFSVEVVAADHVQLTFTTAHQTLDGVDTVLPLADHGYDVTSTGATHLDGTAVSAEELAGISSFYQEGGLSLPVRDALVGRRVDKAQPVKLDAEAVGKLVMLGVPPDMAGELTLVGVDADGLATVTFTSEGTLSENTVTFKVSGKATFDAATLLPRSIEFETHLDGSNQTGDAVSVGSSTGTSTQTFTYD